MLFNSFTLLIVFSSSMYYLLLTTSKIKVVFFIRIKLLLLYELGANVCTINNALNGYYILLCKITSIKMRIPKRGKDFF